MKTRAFIAFLLACALAAILSLATHARIVHIPFAALAAIRWIAVALLAVYATARRSLTLWIVVGLFAGIELGHDTPAAAMHLQILGSIFLRLIKVIIAPLIFGTLVVGIAGHAELRKVGRMAVKALIFFEIVSTIALVIGVVAIDLSRAGAGVHLNAGAAQQQTLVSSAQSTTQLILNVFPENIAKSVAEGQILQVVVFSILFAMGLALVKEPKRRPMVAFAESLSETMFKFTNIVMYLAPVGVFGAIAYTTGRLGLGVMLPLLKLLATLYVALLVFVIFVLLPIALLAHIPLRPFLRAIAEPSTIAFGTSSSEAALPSAMENMEAIGVPRAIVAFVMPTGYSFNLAGGSLYVSLALIFMAQTAGIHLSIGQQALIMLSLMLMSKGIAGVPRAGLVVVLAAANSFHFPTDSFYLLFAVDPLMDMVRTTVNVVGNCLATVVIGRWEHDLPPEPLEFRNQSGAPS
ncbi:MAG TPA: cation:dicarboxylase symporter family transporter [Candidatus Acidoferrales bacterium]|nr:cation:dicarboxylase symporter family transporter [Candidatus Acidoferrales bacterium]